MSATRATDGRPAYTEAQRRAIQADGHVLLEAGAGSGKTTTLVGKILHVMGADVIAAERVAVPCALGEIAAITFTTAAAADLKQALRKRLRAEAVRTGERRWHRAAYEVDRARIGTIHGFCAQILREFALRVGLDPAFRILDAGESAALRDGCVRNVVLRALREGDEEARALVFARGPDDVMALVADAVSAGDAARRAHDAWCDASGPRLDVLRERVLTQGGVWHDELDAASARLGATILRLALRARTDMDERLDREGALDFDALIYRTRDLLRAREDVLHALRRRLAWLFIDEYQDTDPAQRDIAYALCGVDCALRGETDARAPRLCIVGDPKQSIYGFRRADVTLWNQVARDLATLGAPVIPLDVNFRSRAPILALVNDVFGALMPPADGATEAPDHEVRYRPLAAARAYDGDDALVELLMLPTDLKAEERRTAEARRIARRIRAMVDGAEGMVWDGAGARRPVRWRDVALLFRTLGDVRIYEAALRALEIPCYVAAGDGFYRTREVRDVMLLLRALLDGHDDLAWIGLLRSPHVGLTDDALLRLRTARPAGPFSRALDVELPGDDAAALAAALEWMSELRALRDRVPTAALLERALERTGYAAYLLYHDGGDAALANVRKLVRMADARPGESLAAFVAHVDERAASSAREGDAPLHTAGEDVVVLSTVHGAKGLEWPVVFLCDLDRDMAAGGSASPFLHDVDAGIGLKLEQEVEGEREPRVCGAYDCLRMLAAARDRAEEKRVWYVAATRARDRLILCAQPPSAPAPDADADADAPAKEPKPTPARWLLAPLQLDGDATRYGEGARWSAVTLPSDIDGEYARSRSAGPRPPTMAELAGHAAIAPELARRLAPVRGVAPLFRRSATEVMTRARNPDEHRRTYLSGLRDVSFAATARDGEGDGPGGAPGLDARTTGDIVHVMMEMDAATLDRDLDRVLERELSRRLGAEGAAALPAAAVARLRRLVAETRAHATVRRLTAGGAVEHELPFTWFVQSTHGDGAASVFQGAMDLVARVGGALEVLDFKTHRIAAGMERETAAAYELQRDLYALALAEVHEAPAAFGFLFPETGGEVRTTFAAADIAAARARLAAHLQPPVDDSPAEGDA